MSGIPGIWRKRSLVTWLLFPFSMLYLLGHLVNYYLLHRPKKVNAFVICVGNVVVGGAGKTPFCITLGKKLNQLGYNIAFLSRGYGGNLSGAVVEVDVGVHNAGQVGDEALLLARVAPTFVCRDRYLAAEAAVRSGARVLIMDDGLQSNVLHKDYSFLLMDGSYGLGNGCVLPAGPLREPFWMARRRADTCVLVGSRDVVDDAKESCAPVGMAARKRRQAPQLTEQISDSVINVIAKVRILAEPSADTRYFAFCGIGMPDKFYKSLNDAGFAVVGTRSFPDHYMYTDEDLKALEESAGDAVLVTTQKDAVKLSEQALKKVQVVPMELEFELPKALWDKLST